MNENHEHLTDLINEARGGGKVAMDRLFRAIYGEFHRMAETLMGRERPGHTLRPSALVDEAVLRMLNGKALEKAPNRNISSVRRAGPCGRPWWTITASAVRAKAAASGCRWMRSCLTSRRGTWTSRH